MTTTSYAPHREPVVRSLTNQEAHAEKAKLALLLAHRLPDPPSVDLERHACKRFLRAYRDRELH